MLEKIAYFSSNLHSVFFSAWGKRQLSLDVGEGAGEVDAAAFEADPHYHPQTATLRPSPENSHLPRHLHQRLL